MKLSTECLEASQVDSLLLGNLTPEEYEAAQNHLELCETCRARVEATIGPEQWWSDVQSVLLNSRTGSSSQRKASSSDAEPNEPSTAKLLDLLGPTDDPNMLGRIGPYEIIGLLGQGGMGAVFKGFDRSLNRFVAIKMLLPHLAASGAARKRFAREGQAVAAVVDDHVMAIHCVDEWQGVPYLVMTYSRGVSLQKRLSDNGPLEVREILRIGMQAAKGLAAAHAQGIVHRDIKPANIFLDQNVERVQLMDFGLARAVDDASLTRSGTLAGTPQYMSPEQARAETVDQRSDLFSLGSVMYAMCTGHAPFRAESSYSVLRLITDKEPRSIRELNPEIPVWLCAITSKLMAKKASDRFASAQEVAKLLEDCLAHIQQPATTPLPTSLVPNAAIVHRPVFKVTRKGVMTMLGFIGMTLLGTMVWQSTDPPDISGQWASDEWGTVVLEAKEPGHYEGTFRGMSRAADPKVLSIKDFNAGEVKVDFNVVYPDLTRVLDKPNTGTLRINWSRVERRFNGTWKFDIEQTKSSVTPEGASISTKVTGGTSDGRDGTISLRLVENEIRGAWTTSKNTQKESGGPRLADLLWKRIVITVPDGGNVLLGGLAVGDRPAVKQKTVEQNESSSFSDFTPSPPSNNTASESAYSVKAELLPGTGNKRIELPSSSKVSVKLSDGAIIFSGEKNEVDSAVEMNRGILNVLSADEMNRRILSFLKQGEQEFHQLELAEEDLRAAYGNAIDNAKSDEDRERAGNQFDPRNVYTPKYLAFEEKYRGTPAGLKALIKVVGFARSTWISPASAGRVEAIDRLIDHYVAFDGIEQAFGHLRGGVPVPREKELLKAVVEKNPSRHAQAESLIAQLELIRVTLSRHANIEALRERVLHPEEHYPDLWRENEKAVLRELESTNPDQLRAEMKAIIERLEEFSLVPVAKYGMAYKAARHLSHSINKVVIGKPAPEIKAITSVGKQFQLSKLRGSIVLLVFGLNHSSDNDVMYAPLRKLADDYKSRHVEVVMILESDEDRFQSAAALKRQFPWTVIQEPSAGSLSLDWGVRGYPTVFFIDAKGILQSWTVGLPCYDEDSGYDATEVAAELDKLLASKQSHNNDGSKGPIDVKPGSSEPLGANEPQVLPAITVPDSSPPADTMKIDNRAGDSEQSTREQSIMPPIEFDTMEKLAGNDRDSAESRFANEPSWASSSVVSNNTLDGIWDVVEINWCGQVWISNGAQVLIENGKWVGFDPHETEDPTQNIRRDFAIGPDNEFCRIETDGKLRYLQPGRFRLEADQLWLAVQQCSLPSETPIHAIPTVSEPNVTYYRLRRRKAGGQEENTNVTRKQSGAKNSALFNRQTIEDITRIYNDNTAVLRRELFQPPIQDLTVEQMRAALRLAAEIETRDGRPKTGKLLEKFTESGVLSRKNGELLSYGTHEMDENGNTIARMIVPTFLIVNADGPKDERGQLDKEPVVLTSLSLSYRKNGYASQTYEYLTEAKDTLERSRNRTRCQLCISIGNTHDTNSNHSSQLAISTP